MTRAYGIDISVHNGLYIPTASPPHPSDFIIQRMSYIGSSSLKFEKDAKVDVNYEKSRSASVLGAYHYAASYMDWKIQANSFIAAMNNKYDIWGWDVEKTNNTNTSSFINGIVPTLEYLYLTTAKPGLWYVNPDMWASWLKPIQNSIIALLKEYPKIKMWVAHYWYTPNPEAEPNYYALSGCTNMPRDWGVWQYAADSTSPYGKEYGVESVSIDTNVFNGGKDALQDWANVSELPPVVVEPPIVIPSDTYYVNINYANVRSGPASSYALVGTISKNTQVTVYETSGGYSRIGENRWVFGQYLTKMVTPPPPANNGYIVNISVANVRACASSTCTLVGTVTKGTEVFVTDTKNGYSKVGENRWIYSQYLTKE
jgi:hypothetical protein